MGFVGGVVPLIFTIELFHSAIHHHETHSIFVCLIAG